MKKSSIEHGMVEISLNFITPFFFEISSVPHTTKNISDESDGVIFCRLGSTTN
jgi:hypothetical protein